MLKHVQISPLRNRADSVSLRSSTVSSCASSICGSPEPPNDLQRTPSRASSYSSLSEQLPQTTIKVYTNCLKIDIEYKTLGIQWDTTSKEVIAQLLRRLKMRHRDPRLFYLSMEVALRRAGVKTLLVLDDDTRPAILQACHPKGESRFCLQLKPGGLIRVHTSALQPSSQYKSLVISEETTSDELLQLLLSCYSSMEPVEQFSIYEVCPGQEYQRKLHPDDIPLRAQAERMKRGETCHFLVRRNPNYARRRQLLANLNDAITAVAATKSYDANNTHSSLEIDDDADTSSLLDLSIESLSDDLHSIMTSDEDEDCASTSGSSSSSGSSDTSVECATSSSVRKLTSTLNLVKQPTNSNVCLKCRNTFKSCEFCKKNSTKISISNTSPTCPNPATTTVSTPSSAQQSYNPVYNIREIRTATHSFSALGKDKKLLDIHLNAHFDAACRLRSNTSVSYMNAMDVAAAAAAAASNKRLMIMDSNGNGTGNGSGNGSGSVSNPTDANGNSNSNANSHSNSTTTTVAGEAVNNNPAKGLGHFVYL